jgi:hypothetical protein
MFISHMLYVIASVAIFVALLGVFFWYSWKWVERIPDYADCKSKIIFPVFFH